MDLIFGMLFSFIALIWAVYKNIFIGLPLVLILFIFAFLAWKRGYTLKEIVQMSYLGGKKSFLVLEIFVLIGAITGSWLAAGTVPGIVYYGIKYMPPQFFVLFVFLLSSLVSFLLGTALGTVGTIGVSLILMARTGNVNLDLAAGAIIAGAYFGDRCSPMSSSAHLVASLTGTDIYENIKNMFKTGGIPLLLTCGFYLFFSAIKPLNIQENTITEEIINVFEISWLVLLPAVVILVLALWRVDIKISMFVSILIALVISRSLQNNDFFANLGYIIMGFNLPPDNTLAPIIKGGGIISMVKPSFIVFTSCCLTGIFEKTGMLDNLQSFINKARYRWQLFAMTGIFSVLTSIFGCSQTIAVVLTNQLVEKTYKARKVDQYNLALDLENTGIVIAALIPWNIAALVPTTTLNVSPVGFLPYAVYLYFIPLFNLISLKIKGDSKGLKATGKKILYKMPNNRNYKLG